MGELEATIEGTKLPDQLKEYFTTSSSIKESLDETKLKDIEDFYIYYDSLYLFDKSEFSASVITSIRRCKESKMFYFYLRKVLETNLEVSSKDNMYKSEYADDNIQFNRDALNMVFKKAVNDYIDLALGIMGEKKELDLNLTFKALGKLELINELIVDEYYIQKLDEINKMIINNSKNNG